MKETRSSIATYSSRRRSGRCSGESRVESDDAARHLEVGNIIHISQENTLKTCLDMLKFKPEGQEKLSVSIY